MWKGDITMQTISNQVLDLYNDGVYQELKAYYGKTTIFNVLGVERSETRHSAFLCWLLNADASHGLGGEPMKRLLRLYATKMQADDSFRIMLMTGNYELKMSDIVAEKKAADQEDGKRPNLHRSDRMDIWATMTLTDSAGKEWPMALVLENKIYSTEGPDQTERYHQFVANICGNDVRPIEIYLTPTGAKAPQCKSFIQINYQELLDSVIQPLTCLEMPAEAAQILSDYIRNLSKPSTAIDRKTYSILATSAIEKARLMEFYDNHRELFNMAMVAANSQKVGSDSNCKKLIEGTEDLELLAELWVSNEDLFKAVLAELREHSESMMLSPAIYDSVFRDTNRDTTRYNVISNGRMIGCHLSQAQTALHVFRAYLQNNPGTSTKALREAFPRSLNNYSYFQNLQYLFYPAAADNPVWDCGKLKGQQGHGDFYTQEKDLLTTTDGQVMCVKWWKKTDGSFQQLMEHVKHHCPYIQVEEY